MRFYADLHIHSKYSRATSRDCDLEHLASWSRRKGVSVLGTGDFTHPVWRAELKDKLVPAEPGFFRLRPDLEAEVDRITPAACLTPTRFLLSVEISTIYKKGPRTRKVHHLIYVPDFDAAERLVARLTRIGNLHSDGRPILGLDSRHLLELVLESDPGSYLIPAHVWTPWFSVMGSRSGFDAVNDCYDDLAPHVFALETGLSSDPAMNWRISHLDRFRLVSNSDAHSPQKLGREACLFDTELDYFALRSALETGEGYVGTVEFFPEEGKYHMDGHRKCGIRWTPRETRQHQGRCPVCETPVTVGVLSRVEELADRPEDAPPPATAGQVQSLVPLPEILAELNGTGVASVAVERSWRQLTERLGPELAILDALPLEEIATCGPALLPEAIARLRRGEVIRDAGFDGEYGRIRLFREDELKEPAGRRLFDIQMPPAEARAEPPAPAAAMVTTAPESEPVSDDVAALEESHPRLDEDQAAAVFAGPGPLLIVAGPGSGKTRSVTHRMARLVKTETTTPGQCLAITFTRRAAEEMRHRLRRLLGEEQGAAVAVHTFHSLGRSLLQRHAVLAGLSEDWTLADEAAQTDILRNHLGLKAAEARRVLREVSLAKRSDQRLDGPLAAYQRTLEERGLVDFDDLVVQSERLLEAHLDLAAHYRAQYPWIFVDEYQDVDLRQYRLLRLLVARDGNLCAVGDPDQAIYSFRGADVRFFRRFEEDFPGARTLRLTRNYRSTSTIVDASHQMLARSAASPAPVAAREIELERITLHDAASDKAEAEFVVAAIERAIGGHSFFSVDTGRSGSSAERDLSFSDFAILYRTDAQLPLLVAALERSGLPFEKREHDPAALETDWDPRAERVKLLTLHASKGLEFRVVFVVGCEEGLLPLQFGPPVRPGSAAYEEERRLFYVGMTRAQDQLILCRARKRLRRGKVEEQKPSPFLRDIEDRLLSRDRGQARARTAAEAPVAQLSIFEVES